LPLSLPQGRRASMGVFSFPTAWWQRRWASEFELQESSEEEEEEAPGVSLKPQLKLLR